MTNLEYNTIVYNDGIYGIKSNLRKRIQDRTMQSLKRKRSTMRRRKISKIEIILKLSLIISILSLVVVLSIG